MNARRGQQASSAPAYAAVTTGQQVLPVGSAETSLAALFAWKAKPVSNSPLAADLDDPDVLTREILRNPRALAEIAAARADIARGDAVHGVDAVRALRPPR